MVNTNSVVVTSRIRLARNIENMPFIPNSDTKKCLNLIGKVNECVSMLGRYKIYQMGTLSDQDSAVMFGKHLISKELLKNKTSGAVLVNDDETISIMVNEEDHIRAQCILKGMNLETAYSRINEIDDEIESKLKIAYDQTFGYLTSCVTNVGTGLRASVMMFLPALTLSGEIDNVVFAVKKKGLTVRGELGEGSFPLGYLYQVSNGISMGLSERETISLVNSATEKIIELELEARQKMLNENPDFIVDMSWRAYGVLANCYTIDYIEFMKLAGELKLGMSLGLITLNDPELVDKLIIICSDSGIIKLSGKIPSNEELCRLRAEYLRKALKRAKV